MPRRRRLRARLLKEPVVEVKAKHLAAHRLADETRHPRIENERSNGVVVSPQIARVERAAGSAALVTGIACPKPGLFQNAVDDGAKTAQPLGPKGATYEHDAIPLKGVGVLR